MRNNKSVNGRFSGDEILDSPLAAFGNGPPLNVDLSMTAVGWMHLDDQIATFLFSNHGPL